MAKFHNPLDKKNKKASGKGKVTRTTTNTANRKAVSTAVTAENKSRLGFGFLAIVVCFTILIFRLAFWQIIKADDLNAKAAEMQKIDTELDPVRGNIYDRNKKVLAQTVTKYELYGYSLNLYKKKGLDSSAKEKNLRDLSKLSGDSRKEMKKKLSGKDNLVLLAKGLDQSQVNKAQKEWGDDIVVKISL